MAGKGNPISFLEREIRMVLVGKTGVGKSATGNTIIGAGKGAQIFAQVLARTMSVTKKCKQRFGYDLQLVDVPGFFCRFISPEELKKEVMKCLGMSSPGVHAFLFIVRIGRVTEEDKTTLEKLLQCFGEEAKRFVIVVFTGKDDLEEEGETIDNYLRDIPTRLKQFLFDASLRFIAVNNRGTDEEKEKFTKNLIDKVNNMVDENGGQCYTNEMYERCEADFRVDGKENIDEKRQKEFEEKLKQEVAALEKQLQSQRLKMQEVEKQLERERDEEDRLKEYLKALQLILKEEDKKKEENKRQAEQVIAWHNIATSLW